MHSQQYQVFTHKDLDGAVSFLTFLWSKPNSTISFQEISNSEIDTIRNYLKRTINPPDVLVMDLAIRKEFLPDLDQVNITIIDHHSNSESFASQFKKAKILCKSYSSNCLLVRKLFSKYAPAFTEAQKKLILLADDYDSFQLKFDESYDLNVLFWAAYKNQFAKFINDFKDGFISFSSSQKQIIDSVKKQIISETEKLPKFGGFLELKGTKKFAMGVMANNSSNLAIDFLNKKYDPELLFYINSKTEKVSLRQKKSNNPIDLARFAEKFCDGTGHTFAAGGKITPLFMELTKNLKPL